MEGWDAWRCARGRSSAVLVLVSPSQLGSRAPDKWHAALDRLDCTATEAISHLERLETAFHPRLALVIMPIFALANAEVALEASGLSHPVARAVAAGLVIWKLVSIVGCCWIAIRLGWSGCTME